MGNSKTFAFSPSAPFNLFCSLVGSMTELNVMFATIDSSELEAPSGGHDDS
jgi:hypothetical protein